MYIYIVYIEEMNVFYYCKKNHILYDLSQKM